MRNVNIRRDRQLIAETHRRVLRVALGLQAPIVTLYTGSVLRGRQSGGWILAVVPGGVQSVVARSAAIGRLRTLHTVVSIGRRIVLRSRQRDKIIGSPLSVLGNRVCPRIHAR